MAAIPNVTRGQVSVEEYMARFVEGNEKPLCEYVDGELFPKPMPTRAHGKAQANIIIQIHARWSQQFDAIPELTTRLRETQFYIPDLAIEEKTKPIKGRYPGPNDPVFLCVEILSPPDRIGKLIAKCEEYHRWGVPHCWIIDPERKKAWEYTPEDLEPRAVQEQLIAGPIILPLSEVFEGL